MDCGVAKVDWMRLQKPVGIKKHEIAQHHFSLNDNTNPSSILNIKLRNGKCTSGRSIASQNFLLMFCLRISLLINNNCLSIILLFSESKAFQEKYKALSWFRDPRKFDKT